MIRLDKRLELFVDDYLIDTLKGARLQAHEPRPANIALAMTKPWEGGFANYSTVIRDGDRFLLYYRGWRRVNQKGIAVYCLAESRDGIRWTRPSLRLHAFKGNRNTNILLAGDKTTHSFSPFLDTRPGCPKRERFKAIGLVAGPEGKGSALGAFASADGLRWRLLQKEPVIVKDRKTRHAFDSQNVAFWSETEKCYLCYFRTWDGKARRISRATSRDFLRWTPRVQMEYRRLGKPAPVEELYVNQTGPYFRAPHLYVGLAARFMGGKRVVTEAEAAPLKMDEKYQADCSDPVLITSRGGRFYDRTFMEALIRPGPDPKHWTSRTNYPTLNLIQTGPAEMSMFTHEAYAQAGACLRRYTLRLDGLGSVRAPWQGGTMTTKPLTFKGRRLLLNYGCSTAGEIRVAVTTAAGKAIKGFTAEDCTPLFGDRIDHPVAWKGGSLAKLNGRAVRLAFTLKDADLYALRFA